MRTLLFCTASLLAACVLPSVASAWDGHTMTCWITVDENGHVKMSGADSGNPANVGKLKRYSLETYGYVVPNRRCPKSVRLPHPPLAVGSSVMLSPDAVAY